MRWRWHSLGEGGGERKGAAGERRSVNNTCLCLAQNWVTLKSQSRELTSQIPGSLTIGDNNWNIGCGLGLQPQQEWVWWLPPWDRGWDPIREQILKRPSPGEQKQPPLRPYISMSMKPRPIYNELSRRVPRTEKLFL